MIGNAVYFVVLLLVTAVAFIAVLCSVVLTVDGIKKLIDKKSEDNENDFGPVMGQGFPFEPLPTSTTIGIVAAILIAAVTSLPLSLWALKQTGLTAPWKRPVLAEEYEQKREQAEREFLSRIQALEEATKEKQAEHEKVKEEMRKAKETLSTLQKVTYEERQAIIHSGSENSSFAYWSGVSQSLVASALIALAAKACQRLRARSSKHASTKPKDDQAA